MAIKQPLSAKRIVSGNISLRQLFLLCITFVISTADIFLPNYVAQIAKEDAWLSVIIAIILALITVYVAATLQVKMGKNNIVDINVQLLGNIVGRMVAMIIFAELFVSLLIILGQIDDIMINVFLPSTPSLVILTLIMIVVIYGAYHGLEVLCRINEIVIPFGILTLLFVAFGNINEIELKNFLPILYNGISPVLAGALLIYASLGQVVLIVLMAGAHLRTIDHRLVSMSIGAVLVLGIMMLVGVLAIAIFGAEHTAYMRFPALEMVRNIDIYDFIQRFDAVVLGIWVGGITIKLIALLYFCIVIIRQWFRINNNKLLLYFGVGISAIFLADYFFGDSVTLVLFSKNIYPIIQSVLFVFIPLVLLFIKIIKDY